MLAVLLMGLTDDSVRLQVLGEARLGKVRLPTRLLLLVLVGWIRLRWLLLLVEGGVLREG